MVSVFISGRPLWVNPELNASDAFVAAWLPGTEGKGIADVLFRDERHAIAHDFTGRLSFSWPRDPLQTPLNRGDENYRPLFPYGFGLSAREPAGDFPELSEDDPSRLLADKRVPVFDKRPVNGFELFVGDQEGWRVPVTARSASSPSGMVSVRNIDMSTQEDARQVTWHGGGAQISFHGNRPLDLTRLASEKAQLTFDGQGRSAARKQGHIANGQRLPPLGQPGCNRNPAGFAAGRLAARGHQTVAVYRIGNRPALR